MATVITFGVFDPLHAGHINFFKQARALGDRLLVVVARDSVIRQQKQREPFESEAQRLAAIEKVDLVDEALLGDEDPASYQLLTTLDFNTIALGYDQHPEDSTVREKLDAIGKHDVRIVRLQPHHPDRYKSSLLRQKKI